MSQGKANIGEITRQHDLDALTGLRFFAALSVFIAHFCNFQLWTLKPYPQLETLRSSLVVMVLVFFVLSGFILTIAYQRMESSEPSWRERKKFWIARIARMYPVYLLAQLWFAPILLRHRFLTEPTGLALRKSAASGFAALFLVQSWISDRFAISWNGPSWTLSVEAGFYLLFPWLLRGFTRLRTRGLVISAIVLWLLNGWILSTNSHWLAGHMSNPLTNLPVFMAGIVAARLYQNWHALPVARYARLLTIPAVLGMMPVMLHGYRDSRFFPNVIMMLSITTLIYSLASLGWPARLLSKPLMILLGEASYSFYLLQFPVYYTVLWISMRFTGADLLTVDSSLTPQRHVWGFLVLLVVNQTMALLAFLYVERPTRIFLRKWLGARLVHEELAKPAV